MTVLFVCAVRDRALDAFMQPFFTQSLGVAERSFGDEVNRAESPMHAHANDYDLHLIGTYDDATGLLVPTTPPQLVITARAVLKPESP